MVIDDFFKAMSCRDFCLFRGKSVYDLWASPAPVGARLWIARAPTQDLRAAQWQEQAVSYSHGKIIGEVMPPESGNLAFYGELDYEIEGIRYHLSTQMRMAGCTAESGHACRTREP
jgi:PhoPQ-activated pathogenicity-related protein